MSPRTEIDPKRVWSLRCAGLKFWEIGERLAAEMGRPIRFGSESIAKVYAAEERRRYPRPHSGAD